MIDSSYIISRNSRTIIGIMSVLLCFLLLIDWLIIANQRSLLMSETNKQVRHELSLLGQLISEAMNKGDYATVEQFLGAWGNQREDVTAASITLDNGFVIAEYSRSEAGVKESQSELDFEYGNHRHMHLSIIEDRSQLHKLITDLAVNLALISVVLVVVLGVVLWKVLKYSAIEPLEKEIEEHEKTTKKLSEYTAELKASNRELESFSYSVSHDLRTPLRAIDGYSQILLEEYTTQIDKDGLQYLQRIRSGAQRMSHLIDDILSLSKVTRQELEKTSVNLSEIVEQIVERLRASDEDRSIQVNIEKNLKCVADKLLMTQALENLIENAWKYSVNKENASIEFGTVNQGGNVVFYVKDNGIGFEQKYAEKIFGLFQRLHSIDEFDGTGVGLATVHRIITRHEGKVWAESSPDAGAVFYFSLPC